MKTIAIIQARMSSTRLPNKVLINLCNKPILYHIIKRCEQAKCINDVIIATSIENSDDLINEFAFNNDFKCFRGSLQNVLERYYLCSKLEKADIIIRLTGDNPLVDSVIIDEAHTIFLENKLDYLYYKKGLPLGMAVEIFTFKSLEKAYHEAKDKDCIEHVTPYLYKNPFIFHSVIMKDDINNNSDLRWTVDTEQDYNLIKNIYEQLYYQNRYFTYDDILEQYKIHPEWYGMNSDVEQKEIEYKGEI